MPFHLSRTKPISFEGQTRTITEWARYLGLPYSVIYARLKAGWPVNEALTTPVSPRKPQVSRDTRAAEVRTGGGSELPQTVGDRRTVLRSTSGRIGVFTP